MKLQFKNDDHLNGYCDGLATAQRVVEELSNRDNSFIAEVIGTMSAVMRPYKKMVSQCAHRMTNTNYTTTGMEKWCVDCGADLMGVSDENPT